MHFAVIALGAALLAAPSWASCDVQGLINVSLYTAFESSCQVPAGTLLTLYSKDDGQNVTSLDAKLHNTTVGAGSGVSLIGAQGTGAASYSFEVSNAIFELDAAIQISGHFPINSVVTISNNSFHCTSVNTAISNLGGLVIPILLGDGEDFTLMSYSLLSVVHNLVTSSSEAADNEIDGISFRSNFLLHEYSTINISHNHVNVHGSLLASWVNGIDFFRPMYVQGNHTQLVISSNVINGTYASAIAMPPIFATKDSCRCGGDASTRVTVADNAISLTNGLNDNSILYVGFMLLASDAVVEVRGNNATVQNMNGYLELYDDITAGGNSSVVIADNSIMTYGGYPQLYVTGAVRARGNGAFRMDGNTLYRADDISADFPYIFFNGDFEVWDSALISISRNVADYALRTKPVPDGSTAPPRSTPGLISIVDGHQSGPIFYPAIVGVDPAATFVCCDNEYVGVTINTDSRLRASLTEALYLVLSPFALCGIYNVTATPTDLVGVTEPSSTTVQEGLASRVSVLFSIATIFCYFFV